ncbi:hypothetical protein D3C78_1806710 [compost metagenome]
MTFTAGEHTTNLHRVHSAILVGDLEYAVLDAGYHTFTKCSVGELLTRAMGNDLLVASGVGHGPIAHCTDTRTMLDTDEVHTLWRIFN